MSRRGRTMLDIGGLDTDLSDALLLALVKTH